MTRVLMAGMLLVYCAGDAAADAPQAAGDWAGTLNAGGVQLRVVLHLKSTDGSVWSGTLDSLDQGANGIPLQNIAVKGEHVNLEMRSGGASFSGRLDPAKDAITGFWNQGGASLPLSLHRSTGAVELRRPQEPKPPFPYLSEDVTYENPDAPGVRLAGTFTRPKKGGPFPAVLLINGSGPNNRDEEVMGHKPFLVLSDALTRRGIAVLRADKRGIHLSTGNVVAATTQDFAGDAMAGERYLLKRPDVDTSHIGLIGHSEGGVIAPMVAAKMPEVAFIVLLAGPGVPGRLLLPQQVYRLSLANGASEAAAGEARDNEMKLLALVAAPGSGDGNKAKLEAALKQLPEAQREAIERQITSPWFRFFVWFDPATALEKVNCPVLALDGEKDAQVDAEQNLPAIRAALEKGGNNNVTTEALPGLNHLFQDCKTGSVAEYSQIEETMSPKVLKIVSDWIEQQVRGR